MATGISTPCPPMLSKRCSPPSFFLLYYSRPRDEGYTSLRALNTSPPRNHLASLRSSCSPSNYSKLLAYPGGTLKRIGCDRSMSKRFGFKRLVYICCLPTPCPPMLSKRCTVPSNYCDRLRVWRGTTRAKHAQGKPTHSHISPSIIDTKINFSTPFPPMLSEQCLPSYN